jgi:LmbE family N-acetylglucosaminyl deacetylase
LLNIELPGLKTVLALGAHCDDIEIGCGGTLLKLLQAYPDLEVHWVVFASNPVRKLEAEKAANLFLGAAKSPRIIVHAFRDGFLPYHGIEVKEAFEALKKTIQPDLILTHYRHDLHQDHRLVSELTWNTWRNHLIWEFEIPKYDGDMGIPNTFVELAEPLYRRKVELIRECYATQWGKNWFSEDTFLGLMRLRGMECQAGSRHAEAFYTRKQVF